MIIKNNFCLFRISYVVTPHLNRLYLRIIRNNFCLFCTSYVVTPHLKHLDETVQMRGHNIWFC